MNREGKNAVPLIDGELLQRWNAGMFFFPLFFPLPSHPIPSLLLSPASFAMLRVDQTSSHTLTDR